MKCRVYWVNIFALELRTYSIGSFFMRRRSNDCNRHIREAVATNSLCVKMNTWVITLSCSSYALSLDNLILVCIGLSLKRNWEQNTSKEEVLSSPNHTRSQDLQPQCSSFYLLVLILSRMSRLWARNWALQPMQTISTTSLWVKVKRSSLKVPWTLLLGKVTGSFSRWEDDQCDCFVKLVIALTISS